MRPVPLVIAILVTIWLGAVVLGFAPTILCPFRHFLHISCPMCGTTRACLAVFHGDWLGALLENPIFWIWVFWSLVVFVDLWHRVWKAENTVGEHMLRSAMANPWIKGFHAITFVATLVYENVR